jgi:rod shape-determining protein MreD
MKASPAARVYGLGPKLIPASVTLVLAIFSAVPLGIPEYAVVTPNFVLMSVYHWTLYRPDYLSYVAVFLVGLFFDLLTTAPGTAVGVTSLILLIARWAVLTSRRSFVGRGFPFVWAGFAGLAALVAAALWGLGSLLNGRILEPRSFLFQAVLTVGLFPLATLLLARLRRLTAGDA